MLGNFNESVQVQLGSTKRRVMLGWMVSLLFKEILYMQGNTSLNINFTPEEIVTLGDLFPRSPGQ